MPGYIPPHLRQDYKPSKKVSPKPKVKGVHYKSDISGLRTQNEKWHRYTLKNANTPNKKAIHFDQERLSSRTVRKTPLKTILKKKKMRYSRKIVSADMTKTKKIRQHAKSY